MISTKQILTIGMLAALAVVAGSAVTFEGAFAQQDNDQTCTGTDCRNQQVNQENDNGNNDVSGGISFN